MISQIGPVRINPRKALIDELFEQSDGKPRCDHVRRDGSGKPYCGKNLSKGSEISEMRRMVCDTASLQLYCLDETGRHAKCVYFKGEPLD